MKRELAVGEKYLHIKIVGHDYVAAFKNKDKKAGSKEPDYKGDGVAVWISEKKEKQAKQPVATWDDVL
jgi:hypothetical protein